MKASRNGVSTDFFCLVEDLNRGVWLLLLEQRLPELEVGKRPVRTLLDDLLEFAPELVIPAS